MMMFTSFMVTFNFCYTYDCQMALQMKIKSESSDCINLNFDPRCFLKEEKRKKVGIIATCIYKEILKWVSISCIEVPQQGSSINVNAVAYIQVHFATMQTWHASCKFDGWAPVSENGRLAVCATGMLLEQKQVLNQIALCCDSRCRFTS